MPTRARMIFVALLLAPVASAASLDVVSSDDLTLNGRFAALAREGGALLRGRDVATEGEFVNVTGEARLYEWQRNDTPLIGNVQPGATARKRSIDIEGARILLAPTNGYFELRAVPRGGIVSIASPGDVHARGQATLLPAPVNWGGGGIAEAVPLRFEAGWPFVGSYPLTGVEMAEGFPSLDAPELTASGRVALQIFGGRIEIQHPDGSTERHDLGEEDPQETVPGTGIQTVVVRQLILDVELDAARVHATGEWILSAPTLAWDVDGRIAWTGATGRVEDGARSWSFQDADVSLDWAGSVTPAATRARLSTPYEGEGELRQLMIDGRPERVASVPASLPLAAPLTLAAVILLVLTKVGQALVAAAAASLYTRISRADAANHPQRRLLLDLVAAQPNVHARELHRRSGLAWGAFSFHLQMLERAGHVRSSRVDGYTLLRLAQHPDEGAVIPQPVARRIFDSLPSQGEVPLARLSETLNISDDLVRYHVKRLHRRGLVRVDGPRGGLVVSRALAKRGSPEP